MTRHGRRVDGWTTIGGRLRLTRTGSQRASIAAGVAAMAWSAPGEQIAAVIGDVVRTLLDALSHRGHGALRVGVACLPGGGRLVGIQCGDIRSYLLDLDSEAVCVLIAPVLGQPVAA